jgi:2-dehydro-3-deoxyglucarate aldolase/4-hydroxy-2-oxoheptanedioate aldolase
MKRNLVREKILRGEICRGVMCMEFATGGIGRISAAAGAEFAIFDMEHTGWSLETIKMLIATSQSADLCPIVRVPIMDYHHIAHAMDIGAAGIVVPMSKSADSVREAISYALYPPQGKRGCSVALSHDDYLPGELVEKMRFANDNMIFIAQIESVEGLYDVEQIASIDRVDAIWVGPYDLSCSMGIPGQFNNPDLTGAIERVRQAAEKNGKTMVLGTGDPQQLVEGPNQGYRMLIYTSDLSIYYNALKGCMDSIREAWQR